MWEQLRNSGKVFKQIILGIKLKGWKSRVEVIYEGKKKSKSV